MDECIDKEQQQQEDGSPGKVKEGKQPWSGNVLPYGRHVVDGLSACPAHRTDVIAEHRVEDQGTQQHVEPCADPCRALANAPLPLQEGGEVTNVQRIGVYGQNGEVFNVAEVGNGGWNAGCLFACCDGRLTPVAPPWREDRKSVV